MLYQNTLEKTGLPKSLSVDEPWGFADSIEELHALPDGWLEELRKDN